MSTTGLFGRETPRAGGIGHPLISLLEPAAADREHDDPERTRSRAEKVAVRKGRTDDGAIDVFLRKAPAPAWKQGPSTGTVGIDGGTAPIDAGGKLAVWSASVFGRSRASCKYGGKGAMRREMPDGVLLAEHGRGLTRSVIGKGGVSILYSFDLRESTTARRERETQQEKTNKQKQNKKNKQMVYKAVVPPV